MESSPEKSLADAVIEQEDTDTGSPSGSGLKDYLRIFRYADRLDWVLFAISWTSAATSGTTVPLMVLIFGQFTTTFNDFSAGKISAEDYRNKANAKVLYFICLFVARFALTYAATLCGSIAGMRTTRAIREAFLDHIIRLQIWHFDKVSSGAAATQVTTNGTRINQGISEKLSIIIQGLSMFFSSFIVALALQWKLALIVMSIIPVILVVIAVCVTIDAALETRITRIYSQGSVLVQEAVASIKTIHAFWAQDSMVAKFDTFLSRSHEIGLKKGPNYGAMYSIEYLCVFSGMALAFWQGHRMYMSGEIREVGQVFSVNLAIVMAAQSMTVIAPQFTALSNATAAAAELFRIMEQSSELDPLDTSGRMPSAYKGEIKFRDVDFAYPSRLSMKVLRNFSIDIPAGKTTALVGASGSGKSTIVGLLERWYNPLKGSITLDGVELSEYNIKWLRSNIRIVQQEPVLFKGSVFQNVAKGLVDSQRSLSHQTQMGLVMEACKSSNAHDFILELPQGYETEVGERASRLSGGQKQRIAIARSIISNPKILLLDEATSALDPTAEKIVQDALNKVAKNRSVLVIAHRLSTVQNADHIAVMSEGKIVEQGTHQELIGLRKRYYALVLAQDLGRKQGEASDRDIGNSNEGSDDEKRVLDIIHKEEEPEIWQKVGSSQYVGPETVDYSLLRCITLMFAEQRALYPTMFIAVLGCLIGGGTFPAQAITFSRVLNVFQLEGDEAKTQANFWSLIFFVIALANLFAYFILGWLCNIIGCAITHAYRLEMFRRILSLDMEFFDLPHNTSGALTSKLTSMPTQLMELMSVNVFLILIILVNVVSSSIVALVYGWKLTLVVISGGLLPLVLAGYVRIRMETKLEAENGELFAVSAGLASESVMSIRTVASLTLEGEILKEFSDMLGNVVERSIKKMLVTLIWFSLSQSLDFLVMALGFWYGSELLASGDYTATQFYVIFIGILFAGQAAATFFGWTTSLTRAAAAANYILWLRTLKPIIAESESNKDIGPPPNGNGEIALDHLSFRYPSKGSNPVIRDISLSIQPTQFIAIIGPSGSGKSTLISMLQRYYDPTTGHLTISSHPINTFSPRLYRSNLSLVAQEPALYDGTIRENILLGYSTSPPSSLSPETPGDLEFQILQACRQANILHFIESLPLGLSTPCGSRGCSLSGGQRQRIALARALLRKPKILLLDEATSALDTQSERLVQEALARAARDGEGGGRMTVAVAHRLSTVRDADVIFVVKEGRVVESGRHGELVSRRGVYLGMCEAQSLDRTA